jgi:hypothetical protein
MEISQLPKEVKEKALEYQRSANERWNKTTDNLLFSFNWKDTKEEGPYWGHWCVSEFKETES